MSTWAEREACRIEKARSLLRSGVEGQKGTWADLGCGDGIFTAALYCLLAPGSQILALDKSQRALDALRRNFGESFPGASPQTLRADFRQPLSLPPLDGLLMANSFHFVRRKEVVLDGLLTLLKPGGRLILVEYNTNRGNFAVPHPLDEDNFLALAQRVGLQAGRILARIPSSFLGQMYAGMGVAPNKTYRRSPES